MTHHLPDRPCPSVAAARADRGTSLPNRLAPGCGCDAPQSGGSPIGIDAALARIVAHVAPLARTEEIALADAPGRILAEPVRVRHMSPPFDNAAMDGYALATGALQGEGPWTLAVAERVAAGQAADRPLAGASAVRIFTGAPVPAGADAVVMQEAVLREGGSIRLDQRPEPGLNIRAAGSDLAAGQIALEAGWRLGPRQIAACAAAGAARLTVRQRLRVGLLVTGDEVRQTGGARAAAEIWDINTPMLAAALCSPAITLVTCAQGADSRDALQAQLADLAGQVDLLVTTGGLSVGEEDHVKPALDALGAELFFSGVAMKPGKPVSFGRVAGAAWLGLPGNPLSALVTWHLFGTALVARLTGQQQPAATRRHVVTTGAIRRRPGRCELRPARLTGFDAQGRELASFEAGLHSGRVGGLPMADGLMFLPAEADHLPAGALVEFQPFQDI